MKPDDLLAAATDLVRATAGKPRQANLRRAVSTTYYALFHCLAKCCADALIGTAGSARSKPAWEQVYRALDHGAAKKACKNQALVSRFPRSIQDFGNKFIDLQLKRHEADYHPARTYYKSAVLQDITDAAIVIGRFRNEKVKDRRAFAALVLFQIRN